LTRGAGALTGGEIPALAYVSQFSTWTPATTASAHHNVLDITATNVARVVIDVTRAHVNCAATLNVRTDGPLDIVLTGCGSHHYSG
jgi:hypothetical protein